MDEYLGRVIKGYWLREIIAEGGFGGIFLAYQPTIGREVAVKVILPRYANEPDFIRRFESEAQLVARLEHPHIVPLYDYWRSPAGAFLVMRHLKGGSLWDALEKGPMELELIARRLEQICEALAVAHSHRVIHRDIKSENILLDEAGNAYLTDFGIAKDLARGSMITRPGIVMGSPDYLAPEMATGDAVTPQTDIYSLGIVLYEMLTGMLPFPESSPEKLVLMQMHQTLPPITLLRPDASDAVDDVVQTATAKNPRDRYPSALAMAEAFRKAIVTPDEVQPVRPTRLRKVLHSDMTQIPNPYKGLRAFRESDADDFFGRERLVVSILERLSETEGEYARFLALVGPSGSGKTSLINAAIIPELRENTLSGSRDWFLTEMVIGNNPFEQLEVALLSIALTPAFIEGMIDDLRDGEDGLLRVIRLLMAPTSQVFIFIDQFEQLFEKVDEHERRLFLASLYHAVSAKDARLRVVIAMQAEYLEQALLYPDFAALLARRTEFVVPLSVSELREVIRKPAERVALSVKPDLIDHMLLDFSAAGTLPLLQYCLAEVFEHRKSATLEKDVYDEVGGKYALANRAEALFAQLTPPQQEVARHLFTSLLIPTEGRRWMQQALPLGDLMPAKQDHTDAQRVLDLFGRARLLSLDHDRVSRTPTVHVAHESLPRYWSRFGIWLQNLVEESSQDRQD